MRTGTLCAEIDSVSYQVYCQALEILTHSSIPFLVGGAYALERYTGIERHTKDFDVFLRPRDCQRALDLFAAEGFRTELTFSHWLGKAYRGDDFIDFIFSSGNGVATVDDDWFQHAVDTEVLGYPVRVCPAEEIIWSKSFVVERERYDGADINHLIRATGERLDWDRLLARFGPHWRVLMSHLVLFGFVYPSERDKVPERVMKVLLRQLEQELTTPPAAERICQGTLLSRGQYLMDVERWGYRDARLAPRGPMTAGEIAVWTEAIGT